MSININVPLQSRPQRINAGQNAQLVLGLQTTQSPSEMAQITYRVNAPGTVFVSTGTPVLTTSQLVLPTGTTSTTPYALRGPSGGVPIRASVIPAQPPAVGGTMVVLDSGAPRGATRSAEVIREATRAARPLSAAPRKAATPKPRTGKAGSSTKTAKALASRRRVLKRRRTLPRPGSKE